MTENCDICTCELRKKIIINITQVLEEDECGVADAALVDILDFELNGPKGQPVLRIRFCPWCGKKAPKPERISHFDTDDDSESDESWRGSGD